MVLKLTGRLTSRTDEPKRRRCYGKAGRRPVDTGNLAIWQFSHENCFCKSTKYRWTLKPHPRIIEKEVKSNYSFEICCHVGRDALRKTMDKARRTISGPGLETRLSKTRSRNSNHKDHCIRSKRLSSLTYWLTQFRSADLWNVTVFVVCCEWRGSARSVFANLTSGAWNVKLQMWNKSTNKRTNRQIKSDCWSLQWMMSSAFVGRGKEPTHLQRLETGTSGLKASPTCPTAEQQSIQPVTLAQPVRAATVPQSLCQFASVYITGCLQAVNVALQSWSSHGYDYGKYYEHHLWFDSV
jgi:hypothetical protein